MIIDLIAERSHGRLDLLNDCGEGFGDTFQQDSLQALQPKFISARIRSFNDPVRSNEEEVSGFRFQFVAREGRAGNQTQRKLRILQALNLPRAIANMKDRRMPGGRVFEQKVLL